MKKILAIDDNLDNLIVLRALLMESFPEAQFISCQSGKKGIELALAQHPDVILLDLVMPEMDGYEVCQALKKNETTRIIPVVIVTAARTDKESRIKALEVGADAFLAKPLDESELTVQIRAMLRIKESEDRKIFEKEQLIKLVAERTQELETSQLAMLNLLEDLKAENESRKKVEIALRESETHYRTLANSGQALIWTSGTDMKCDYFNQPWLDFTGRTLEQELGNGWMEGVHPDDLEYCISTYTAAFNRQEKFSVEYRILHADESYRWIQDNGSPRYNSQGEFIGYIGHCLDITEHKLIEQKIEDNEKLLTNIIENIPITLIIKDVKTLQYTMINKAGEILFDDIRKNILGKNAYELFHMPDADYLTNNDLEVIQSETANDSGEKEVYFKNGKCRVIHTIRVPIKDETQQIRSLLVLSEDVTEKKKMQDALKESEELYRTLLNASPEAIVIINTEKCIVEVSDRALDLFGISNKEELINKDIFQLIPQSEVDKLQAILSETLLERLVHNVEILLKKQDETQISCELSTTLIQEANGNPKAYMAILRDISDRKEMERQLIRTERMVSLGEMASAMAHEINQPLLSISLGIDNLLMKVKQANILDESYLTMKTEKIFDDVARISRLIDHVRTFSRDHDREKPVPININESVRNAISMISEQFSHHGIVLTIKCDPDIPVVMGNTYQFEQVILNLLTNAKDALEEKKNTIQQDFDMTISLKTYYDERFNYVEVEDNGIGIRSADIDKIMLPFFTTKEIGKGTGLGLSISFGIVKEMGGTLQVQSEPLIGTKFIVVLPVVPIQQEIQWMQH